jgi:hypothetical protein
MLNISSIRVISDLKIAYVILIIGSFCHLFSKLKVSLMQLLSLLL